MNDTANASDPLDRFGKAILTLDTRWVVVGAIVCVVLFLVLLRVIKKRNLSREDITTLGLTILQLYSAPVLFSVLVLTQPPAFHLMSNFQRQSAGLLAFIFLTAGIYAQIKKFWSGPEAAANTSANSANGAANPGSQVTPSAGGQETKQKN